MLICRAAVIAVVFSYLAAFGVQSAGIAAEPVVGIVAEKPTEGHYVKVKQGYMVPYTMTIPGTEVQYTMVPVPAGSFKLGSPDSEQDRNKDEGPQIEVAMEPFWIGKYEVTWAEYKEFMKLYAVFKEFETRAVRKVTDENLQDAITAPTELYDPTFTFEFGEDPQQPAVTMTQYAARQYTKWISAVTGHQYRLPSEAEWEYACRAGTSTAYHFGDDASKLGEYGWCLDNSEEAPQKVGLKKPNAWGIHDMHGNVWEWVIDEYFEEGYAELEGEAHQADQVLRWPTKAYPRVVRGGSWDDEPQSCRSAAKLASHDVDWKSEDPNLPLSPWWFTSDPSRAVGFRYVRPLKKVAQEDLEAFYRADAEEIQFDVKARLDEGRGVLGLVDEKLPAAIKELGTP